MQLYPNDLSIGELLRTVEDAHRPIARYFGTGIGHELQFVESQILVRILGELLRAGAVALPVHDCIIVPRSAVALARETMAAVTKAEIGVVVPVTVETAGAEEALLRSLSAPINPPGGAGGL